MQSATFPHLYSTVGNNGRFTQCPCTDPSYTILVFGKGTTLFLSGAFSFQVLYGCISVNGFLFTSSRFNASNFTPISIPQGHLPASFSICNDLSIEVHIERIQSRLREFVNDSRMILPFIDEYKPVAILLVKLEMDIVSHFVKQQSQWLINVFSQTGFQLGNNLFCSNVAEAGEESSSSTNSSWSIQNVESMRTLEEDYRHVLTRIGKTLESETCCIIQIVGNKGVGKSTMCRYLLNSLNTRKRSNSDPSERCRVFLLDLDVGQSEFSPSGCVSLFETTKPLISAPFVSLEPSFTNSYFFGSNTISVDFDLYLNLAGRLLQQFISFEMNSESAGEKCVLVVNTPGWIEDLGYDIMLKIIRLINPNILVCIDRAGVGNGISFEVPKHLQRFTMRIRVNGECPQLPLFGNSSLLRNLLSVGYIAQTFRQFNPKRFFGQCAELRLADTFATYRIPFRSVSIYIHPEVLHIEDHLMLNVLNCSFVALCRVENGYEKCFERRPLLADASLPSRLLLRPCCVDGAVPSQNCNEKTPESDDIIELNVGLTDETKKLPILRCIGFGLIRAINPERKLLYIITPVEQRHLGKVDVLALGHCLNTPELIFPMNPYAEAVPYSVELRHNKTIDEKHKKLFSPLRVVTGSKRALQARLMQTAATNVQKSTKNGTRTNVVCHLQQKRIRLS